MAFLIKSDEYPDLAVIDQSGAIWLTEDESRAVFFLDCRFQFEFDGGSVVRAINVSSEDQLRHWWDEVTNSHIPQQLTAVFYCTNSADLAASKLRFFKEVLQKKCPFQAVTCFLMQGSMESLRKAPDTSLFPRTAGEDSTSNDLSNGDMGQCQSALKAMREAFNEAQSKGVKEMARIGCNCRYPNLHVVPVEAAGVGEGVLPVERQKDEAGALDVTPAADKEEGDSEPDGAGLAL